MARARRVLRIRGLQVGLQGPACCGSWRAGWRPHEGSCDGCWQHDCALWPASRRPLPGSGIPAECVRARGRAAVTGAGGEPAAEGSEAADLHAIGVSNDCEDTKATVDPDESSALVLRSMLMAPAGMEGRSFDVQAHIPSVNASGDRRGQDSGARCCYGLTRTWVEVLDGSEHPPQPPGVVVHPDGSDLQEGNRPGMSLSDADSVAAARILLVSETKLSRCRPLRLCRGKPTWPYHGTVADKSVSAAASASVTSRRL
jgi:hypothetical protein